MEVTVRANSSVRESAIRAVLPAMRRLGEDIVEDMHLHPWHNRTGHLEGSTEFSVDERTGKLTIGNTAKQAHFIEFGTQNAEALPWLAPALFRNRGRRS